MRNLVQELSDSAFRLIANHRHTCLSQLLLGSSLYVRLAHSSFLLGSLFVISGSRLHITQVSVLDPLNVCLLSERVGSGTLLAHGIDVHLAIFFVDGFLEVGAHELG